MCQNYKGVWAPKTVGQIPDVTLHNADVDKLSLANFHLSHLSCKRGELTVWPSKNIILQGSNCVKKLEGTACYAGFLLAPAEGKTMAFIS